MKRIDQVTQEAHDFALEDGWTDFACCHGYERFTGDYPTELGYIEADHIERIDIMETWDTDAQAAQDAEERGYYRIIRDVAGLDPVFIDTPKNRRRVLEQWRGLTLGRLLQNPVTPDYFWTSITEEPAPGITTTDELRDRLDAAGWEVVWDYCLEDIDEAAANNYHLVLVQGPGEAGRLYEIPEAYVHRFTGAGQQQAEAGKKCPHCGGPLFFSDIPEYAFQCFTCDEDFYNVEVR